VRKPNIIFTIIILILTTLACQTSISEVLGNSGEPDVFGTEVQFSKNLTATLFRLETLIAEATEEAEATAAAQPTETPTPPATNNLEAFCAIYTEFVEDLVARANHYEEVVAAGGDGDPLAAQMDVAIEGFMDRLAKPAPDEIWPVVEELAGMSLTGIVSSQEGVPAAEPLIEQLDDYAADNCGVSLGESDE
jgi:hypothetical protein